MKRQRWPARNGGGGRISPGSSPRVPYQASDTRDGTPSPETARVRIEDEARSALPRLRQAGNHAFDLDVAPLPGPRQLVGQSSLRAPCREVVAGDEPRRRDEQRARAGPPRQPRRERERHGEPEETDVRQPRRLLQDGGAGHEEGGEKAQGRAREGARGRRKMPLG